MRDIVIAACGLAVVALLAVIVYQDYRRFHKPLLTTKYQAVTLTNGDVLYGRIDHFGSDHPVLRDAVSTLPSWIHRPNSRATFSRDAETALPELTT